MGSVLGAQNGYDHLYDARRSCSFHGELECASTSLRRQETSFRDGIFQSTESGPVARFDGDLDLKEIADLETDGLLMRRLQADGTNRRRRKTYKRRVTRGSCVLWMREKARFLCGICGGSSSAPWSWSSAKLTVFGLRKDGHTWEKCVVANEHLKSVYTPPPLWKRMLRRLRARARRADCWSTCYQQQPNQDTFYYDPVSYALNFDDSNDSNGCMQHHHHQVYCPHGSPLVKPLDSDAE